MHIKKHFFLDKENQMCCCHFPLLQLNTGSYYACESSLEICCRQKKIPNYQYNKHTDIDELKFVTICIFWKELQWSFVQAVTENKEARLDVQKYVLIFCGLGLEVYFFFPSFNLKMWLLQKIWKRAWSGWCIADSRLCPVSEVWGCWGERCLSAGCQWWCPSNHKYVRNV